MLRFGAFLLVVVSVGCAVDKNDSGVLERPDTGGITLDVASIDGQSDTFIDRDAACGIETAQANITPLNLYVMFDKSSSMGPDVTSTKWAGARKGMAAFVNDPASTGLRIALNFFPRPVDGTPSCDSAAYMAPRVAYDLLPANAPKIIAAIDAEQPNGFNTPIYPALGGALRASIDAVKARPGEAGAVVLITDGEPQGPAPLCGSVNPEDPAVIANLAATAFKGTPPIRTFVVGLPGVNVSVANQIAVAGGSGAAVLATDPTKVDDGFRDALALVRGKALSCELNLPSKVIKGEISYALVNVLYSKGSGPTATTLLQDPTCASGEGWRYNSTTMPTAIVLCPKTCAEVQADPKAKVEILLGCKTAIR
jgi:hypothetical protein